MPLFFFLLAIFHSAYAVSFDCQKAITYPEKAICSDKNLSDLDDLLAKAYGAALLVHPELPKEQRLWLKRRNSCSNHDCLAIAYHDRIAELGHQANKEDEVCKQLARQVQIEGALVLRENSDEKALGTLCGFEGVSCKDVEHPFDIAQLRERGINHADNRLESFTDKFNAYTTYVSTADINNDGIPDLRLSRVSGTRRCEGNLFYLGTLNGKYRTTQGSAIDNTLAGGEGAFCGPNGVVFMKRGKVTYSVVLRIGPKSVSTVYRGVVDGSLTTHCQFHELPMSDEQSHIIDLVRKRYPPMIEKSKLKRPVLVTLSSSRGFEEIIAMLHLKNDEKVWAVRAACDDAHSRIHSTFYIHPKTMAIAPSYGKDSHSDCLMD